MGAGGGRRGAHRRRSPVRRARPRRQPPSRREAASALFTDQYGSAGDGSLLEGRLDLAGMGKAACLLLGEDQLVVDGDFEDSTGSLDELGLDAELLLDLLRQTGGAGVVVSDPAVLDDDARGHTRLLSPPDYSRWIIASLLFKIGIKWRQSLLLNYKVRLEA
jgi:hypothetical protein